MHAFKNNRGIALLLVLGSILILTTVVVEFSFRSNVHYHLALNNADRLQAYYLAESAINFSRLLIKYDKEMQRQLGSANVDIAVEPLYDLFPLSSALLRGAMEGGVTAPSDEEPEEVESEDNSEGETADEEGGSDSIGTALSILQSKEAQDFLSFTGDFELEIDEAESKYDLNIFNNLQTTDPQHDARKRWLIALMQLASFGRYFEKLDGDVTPETVANALIDWVDKNDTVGDFGAVERGSESDLYSDVDYSPKNGKLTTLAEIGLIPGITPELFGMLGPALTVYTTKGQFNPCLADETLVQALVVMLTQTNTCVSPLSFESDSEQIDQLVSAFVGACPKIDSMVQALHDALGLSIGGETRQDCGSFDLTQLLTDKREVFEIIGRGVVGETTVEIRTVVNASGERPDAWPFFYWRVN